MLPLLPVLCHSRARNTSKNHDFSEEKQSVYILQSRHTTNTSPGRLAAFALLHLFRIHSSRALSSAGCSKLRLRQQHRLAFTLKAALDQHIGRRLDHYPSSSANSSVRQLLPRARTETAKPRSQQANRQRLVPVPCHSVPCPLLVCQDSSTFFFFFFPIRPLQQSTEHFVFWARTQLPCQLSPLLHLSCWSSPLKFPCLCQT